jgi:hypothetical protein
MSDRPDRPEDPRARGTDEQPGTRDPTDFDGQFDEAGRYIGLERGEPDVPPASPIAAGAAMPAPRPMVDLSMPASAPPPDLLTPGDPDSDPDDFGNVIIRERLR